MLADFFRKEAVVYRRVELIFKTPLIWAYGAISSEITVFCRFSEKSKMRNIFAAIVFAISHIPLASKFLY